MVEHLFCKQAIAGSTPVLGSIFMSDNNYKSIADVDGFVLQDQVINPDSTGTDPRTIDDVLKFSNARNGRVSNVIVNAHGLQKENAIDMNRGCVNVLFNTIRLVSGCQNAITIKGGCRNIDFTNVEITPGQGHCDIELGSWSDQSQEKVEAISFNHISKSDGSPIRLRVGHAAYPSILNSKVEYLWFQSLLLKAYVFLKGLLHAKS